MKPIKELKKDIRPISLTQCISTVAEDFIITQYVKPAGLSVLDPSQYGAIPKYSKTLALLEMIPSWTTQLQYFTIREGRGGGAAY